MKTPPRHSTPAFTLIELLVVIAIIAILAAMLFPAIGIAKKKAAEARAKVEMQNIGVAITRYEADYNGRFPAPGMQTGTDDVTFGFTAGGGVTGVIAIPTNSGVIAVLMDLEYDKTTNAVKTANFGHVLNPRRIANLNANFASDQNSAGVDQLLEYRDPWGRPYVISMDTSLNDRCRDQLYSRTAVSQEGGQKGFFGLFNPGNTPNQFEHNGKYMVWSLGADGRAEVGVKAKDGVNRDNLIGWRE